VLRYSYARRAPQRPEIPPQLRLGRGERDRRGRPGDPPTAAGGAAEAPRAAPSEVRSLEEQVLAGLLDGGADPPPPAELPSEEVFFDPRCRNIYRAWCDLYLRRGGAPDARQVVDALGGDEAAVDRAAAILLEGPFAPEAAGLPDSIARLVRRWRQKRLREMAREIQEAQRVGDASRLESLLDEKDALSRRLHGAAARNGP
jgi:hypothetical protein